MAYLSLQFGGPRRPQIIDQAAQCHQVSYPQPGPSRGEDDERILTADIGPARRHTVQLAVITDEEHPVLSPSVLAHNQIKLPARQRMKRMRDPHPLLLTRPTGRNRQVGPRAASRVRSAGSAAATSSRCR